MVSAVSRWVCANRVRRVGLGGWIRLEGGRCGTGS